MLYLILLIIAILLIKYLLPKIKGHIGELLIRFILLFLNRKEYKIINNVRIFYNGLMSQIDHIVVSKYGIFVIETKNYKGWIFGNEYSYEWTQVIFNNKYKLYNPIRQNIGHIKALKAHLGEYTNLNYFPIVVFTGSASLKISSSFPVVKYYRLLTTIKGCREINISDNVRDEIYNFLLKTNGNKPTITPKKSDEQSPFKQSNKCPYCNNPLIPREGKYGHFLGCTDFPRCRYTKKIK